MSWSWRTLHFIIQPRVAFISIALCGAIAFGAVAATAQSPAAPWWAQPANTTTGIPAVDAVIQAMTQQDAAALQSQLIFTPQPCTPPGAGEFLCPEGQPVGTLVDAFLIASCEGSFIPRENQSSGDAAAFAGLGAAMTSRPQYLYAVGRTDPGNDDAYRFVLVFGSATDPATALGERVLDREVAAHMVYVDAQAQGVSGVNTGCAEGVAGRVQEVHEFILRPRTAPDAPQTGTGATTTESSLPPLLVVGLLALATGGLCAAGALAARRR